MGVSSRLNPKLALMQLKRQVGDYGGVPLEERVPEGYEKIGTPNKYGPNYPYSSAIAKILNAKKANIKIKNLFSISCVPCTPTRGVRAALWRDAVDPHVGPFQLAPQPAPQFYITQ